MKKAQIIATYSVLAAVIGGYSSEAKAQSADEQLAPLIYILLDTSGSMNDLVDEAANQTRLTKAIGELAGGMKLAVNEPLDRPSCPDPLSCDESDDACRNCSTLNAFKMPFPVWRCTESNCGYTYELKTIPGNAQIAKPQGATNDVTVSTDSYRNALAAKYREDGIIQAYQSVVKFGAAGMAVGSAGSSADKDASVIQQAAALAGGRVDGVLRSTMIWNDDNDTNCDSDLDFHAVVYRNGEPLESIDWCNKGYYYSCNGVINTTEDFTGISAYFCTNNYDVTEIRNDDITGYVYTNHEDHVITCTYYDPFDCTKRTTSSSGGELDVDIIQPSAGRYPKPPVTLPGYSNTLGVENITWNDVSNLQAGDQIYFFVNPFGQNTYNGKNCGEEGGFCVNCTTKGFRAEIAFPDSTSGCPTLYTFDYKANIESTDYAGLCEQTSLSAKDIPLAIVTYHGLDSDGKPRFSINEDTIGSFDGKDISASLEDEQMGVGNPDNIYGFSSVGTVQASGLSDVSYGRNDIDSPPLAYKHPSDCTLDIGIWDSAIDAHAPLFYPTPANNKDDISTSNARLIDALRTYQAHSATPIGESLADMYYLFGLDSSNYSTVDKGIVTRKDLDQPNSRIIDEAYACRDKAVILITDGSPNGSGIATDDGGEGIGHHSHIWYDADWLYSKSKADPVKTYVIAYAFGDSEDENIDTQDPLDETTAAYKLNMTAWKGGTCRHPVTHELILPTDEEAYKEMVEYSKTPETRRPANLRHCFYSASNGTALRKAMAEALSDTLQGTVSKTAVATSAALGYVQNIHDNKYENGYYNVYSGYEVTPGLVRRTILQRESTICDTTTGQFEAGQQHMDLSTILSCRLNKNCMNLNEEAALTSAQERAQIVKDIANKTGVGTPCAARGSEGIIEVSGNDNSCLSNRYIFAGDYSEDRYKINPDIVSINPELTPGESEAGVPKGIGFVKNAAGLNQDENYIINKNKVENIPISQMYSKSSANYILSPYECGSDLDCVKEGREGYCDLGRCVTGEEYNRATTCDSMRYTDSEVCIAGKIRTRYTGDDACEYHFAEAAHDDVAEKKGCGEGLVCHAGKCLPGTVIGGNLKSFMTTMPLGTIEYATPVPVEPPTRTVRSASYLKFSQQHWNRDNLLMVAANDGMLHAFILGQNQPNSDGYAVDRAIRGATPPLHLSEGDELWAFVPKATMPRLGRLPNFGQQTFLNASPTVVDVPNPDDEWRTVAVGAFGNGARGYYALDITDPLNPSILWEIDNQWQAAEVPSVYPDMSIFDSEVYSEESALINNIKNLEPGSNMNGFPFADMGYSSAKPLITRMLIKSGEGDSAVSKVETVAILPGGSRKEKKEGAGALYIVRLFPDAETKDLLVAAIYTKHDITSSPAVYPSNFNSIAQRLYFGDKKGNFYALDVSNFEPAKWAKNSFPSNVNIETDTTTDIKYLRPSFGADCEHIPDVYSAITYKPAVSLYTAGVHPTIQIVFGTGDNSDLTTTSGEHNYVARFFDVYQGAGGYQLNPATGLSEPAQLYVFNKPETLTEGENSVSIGACNSSAMAFDVVARPPRDSDSSEEKDPFPAAQKMSGSALTYDYDTYFPTYISNTESSGDYDKLCKVGNAAIFRIRSAKKHGHVDSSAVRNNENNNDIASNLDKNGFITLNQGTRIYGLEVSSQQMCIGTSHTEIAAPRLIAQTSVDGANLNAGDKHNELADMNTDIANFALNLDAIRPGVKPISWASVYE